MRTKETVVKIENNEGGFGFHLGQASKSHPAINSFYLPDGSTIKYTFPLDKITGWHRYKLFLDLDANDGAGSITMFVAEMEGDYVAVPEISDLNLGMTPGTGTSSDPATWTKMFIHATGGNSGFDNLYIEQPDTGGKLYQYITFNPLPDHLSTDAPFAIDATSNQGLDVQFSIVSGPATISGNIITLTGEAGTVSVKASQPGNDNVAKADDVTQSFEVIDPLTVIPEMKIRNVVEGGVIRMPELMDMKFSVSANIAHPELLHIASATFTVDGEEVHGYETSNGFFVADWVPPAYGKYDVNVSVTSSGGVTISDDVSFEITADAPSMQFKVLDAFDFDGENTIDTSFNLPSFAGTYKKITATLEYNCPCDPWDRVARVHIRGANGQWMELFKYVTPYGVACSDQIDITDFVSQLQGNVDFKIAFPKSIVSITFDYEEGTPEYKYSWMDNLWQGTYPFGDYANLQPVEIKTLNLSAGVEKAYLRLLSGGFAWGQTNTDNAAEFYDATHNININGNTEYQQHLWQTCNPNPASCQPQNGTWYYNRHGWCPGSIPILFRYDLSRWIGVGNVKLQYEFYPGYVDYCHPNHPDCVTGVTCSNCDDTYNPQINVSGELILLSNDVIISGVKNIKPKEGIFSVVPNPSSTGLFTISSLDAEFSSNSTIEIYNTAGLLLKTYSSVPDIGMEIDLSGFSKGVYLMLLKNKKQSLTRKLIIQ